MRTLLTIDWDTFIPEDPNWDWGHKESLLYLTTLWATRGNMIDTMVTTGEERTFWNKVDLDRAKWLSDNKIYVSDSHAFVWTIARPFDRIIIIDAHHDMWTSISIECEPPEDTQVYCSTWLRQWLYQNSRRRALWVQPSWSLKHWKLPKGIYPIATRRTLDKIQRIQADVIHVCRSGCWTPPWLDEQFKEFVIASSMKPEILQNDEWNPMKPRWGPSDMRAAIKSAKEMAKIMRERQKVRMPQAV